MGLKHASWSAIQAETRQPVVINPAQVRFLRGTPDRQTEVWFTREMVITVATDLVNTELMFESDNDP